MNQKQVSQNLYKQALELDKDDPLNNKKSLFYIPQGKIYLDGNSLGPLPLCARQRAKEVVENQWGEGLIESWNTHSWIDLPLNIGNKIARLIGSEQGSVICCDSISVNLFKVLAAAINLTHKKPWILSQADNFPTDLYMVEGLIHLLNTNNEDGFYQLKTVKPADIEQTIAEHAKQIGVLLLTHANYKTGDIFDMQAITELAHKHNIIVIWDLAHSAGVLPLQLEKCKVDFAVGCTYKYLNGGPGAPAFVYVAPKYLPVIEQPLCGWMGHKHPFTFSQHYEKAKGIEQMLCGTPSIISMSVLDAALDVFDGIDTQEIRDKSIRLNSFFQRTLFELSSVSNTTVNLGCKESASQRGSQISILHGDAYAICQCLISKKVIPDFRSPNVLRLGFSPLYLSFLEVYQAASILHETLVTQEYLKPQYQIENKVT